MKILVTGGAGYTGTPLVAALISAGHEVTVADTFASGATAMFGLSVSPQFSALRVDLRDLKRDQVASFEAVFHLAAISGYPECAAWPHEAWDINVSGTERLLSLLRDDQKFIFASTTSFYGSSGTPSDESTPLQPASLYGESKARAEGMALERSQTISLRWATVFGLSPRLRLSLMINDFTLRAMEDRSITLYDPDSKRSFIHVNDMVRGYLFALDNWTAMQGQVFNMGSESLNLSKYEVARLVQAEVPCDIFVSDRRDMDVRHFFVKYGKISDLGWRCERDITQGVRELAKAYRMILPKEPTL